MNLYMNYPVPDFDNGQFQVYLGPKGIILEFGFKYWFCLSDLTELVRFLEKKGIRLTE